MQTYYNLIAGKPVESVSGRTFSNLNPAHTDQVLGLFQQSDAEDVRRACEAAGKAFEKWKNSNWAQKCRILKNTIAILKQRKDEIARVLTEEQGRPLSESRAEVDRTIDIIDFYSGESGRDQGWVMPSERPDTVAFTKRKPVGVFALITPWNFPLVVPAWKIVPAIVYGNTVLFKPATSTPHTGLLFCEILQEAGLPDGVVNYITGRGADIGNAIINHPSIQGVSFTGSTEVGLDIYQRAAKSGRFIRAQLELGGKNPMIILKDADLQLARDDAFTACFTNCGQRCTASSRIILEKEIAGKFTEMFVEKIKRLKIGNGLEDDVQVGPITNKRQYETVLKYLQIGRDEGAKVLCGGRPLTEGKYAKGYFVEPTIFAGVRPDMRIATEEIFGPVVCLVTVDDFSQAMKVANNISYGLSASIYTNDQRKAHRFLDEIESGMAHVNSPSVFNETNMPFGGIKMSGFGPRENGKTNIEFYTEIKSMYIRHI